MRVVHIRRRGIKRTAAFSVGGDMVRVYKATNIIVNVYMDCREMVGERSKAGRGALCASMEMRSEYGGGEGQNLYEALGSLGWVSVNVDWYIDNTCHE